MHTSVFSSLLRFRTGLAAAVVLSSALVFPGCTKQQLANAASYLIIDSLQAAPGASTTFGGTLSSDVLTIVSGTPTIFADNGRFTLRLGLTDPGSVDSPSSPSTANYITVTRFHVKYTRTDGLNTQGVHVPFEFEGGLTVTVGDAPVTVGFTLVNAFAKDRAPLADLVNGGSIPTVAEVTLFGTDQVGRAVSVKGTISVVFRNWGDPTS